MMDNHTGILVLSWQDLVVASLLILIAGGVSLWFRLGLERRLLIASLRTVSQLLFIGYVLKIVFHWEWWLLIVGVSLIMITIAAHAAVARSSRQFTGVLWRSFISLFVCSLFTTVTVTAIIIRVDPWYNPQYLIPLLGMVLGNSLTGISLCLDHLLELLSQRKAQVEMELALGASRWEAAHPPLSEAIRKGMIPIINNMMVVGLVSLPGMMTGQILAGSDPMIAVGYQIMVMFMIAAASSLGCIVVVLLIYLRLFNSQHQLQAALITEKHRR